MSKFYSTRHQSVFRNLSFMLTLTLVLSSCQTMQQGSYTGNCVKGGLAGGIAGAAWKAVTGGSKSDTVKTALIGAAAGCVIGLAATAVGEALNDKEREKHDEAFQTAAQTSSDQIAEERQRIEERYQEMEPSPTEADKTKQQQEIETEIQKTVFKNPQEQAWEDNTGGSSTKGKVIVVGTSDGQVAKAGGDTNCLQVQEWVVKDGKEISQTSDACQDENGKWVRMAT